MNIDPTSYSMLLSSKLEIFCKPLKEHFGIGLFVHMKVWKNCDKYQIISNNPSFCKNYILNTKRGNIFFSQYLNVQSDYQYVLWPKYVENDICADLYLSMGYWHGLTAIIQNEEYTELFVFLSDKDNESINQFYIRYYNILEKLIRQYRYQFSNYIITNYTDNRLARFANGCSHNWPIKTDHDIEKTIDLFFKEMNIPNIKFEINGMEINFSKREIQCLDLLNKGHSLKTMGRELLISPRTAETHMKNIKNKTGLTTKQNLIKLYQGAFNG